MKPNASATPAWQPPAPMRPTNFSEAMLQIEQFPATRAVVEPFTFEDIVTALTPLIGPPPSRALPGTICMHAIRRKLIERAGGYRAATGLQKHGHENKLYRWRCA